MNRSRRHALGAGVGVLVLVLLSACAASPPAASGPPSAGSALETAQTVQHWTRPLRRVDVDEPLGPGGGIDVAPGPAGQLAETLDLSWRGARPVTGEDWGVADPARVDPAGDARRTTVGCAAPTPPEATHDCAAHYRIALPADAGLGARTTVDPITARDLRGDTALTTTTGPITMAGLAGTIRATSDHGAVVGTGLSPETIYVVAGGPVSLRLDAPPREMRVDGGAGPVTLELPRGVPYAVETGVRAPTARPARIEVATDPGSSNLVEARSDGDLVVRYRP